MWLIFYLSINHSLTAMTLLSLEQTVEKARSENQGHSYYGMLIGTLTILRALSNVAISSDIE